VDRQGKSRGRLQGPRAVRTGRRDTRGAPPGAQGPGAIAEAPGRVPHERLGAERGGLSPPAAPSTQPPDGMRPGDTNSSAT
jgi:hypothetical protein